MSFVFISFLTTACFFGNNYVIKINNDKIGINEFLVYLFEQKKMFEQKGGDDIWETDFDGLKAEDVAKQNAINSIVLVKTAVKQAKELKIELTKEEINSAKEESQILYDEMKQFYGEDFDITKSEIDKIIIESSIQQKMFDFITNGFEISKTDFESYFNEYYEKNKKQIKKISIRYIFIKKADSEELIEDREKFVEDIYAKVLTGENFETLQEQYSQDDNKGIVQMKEGLFEIEIEDEIYNLNKDDISGILQTSNGYYIIKAVEVDTSDIENLKEEIKIKYAEEKKQEIYKNQSDKWALNTVIEKNEDIWNAIHVK